ncbi:hypothetical protein LY76DRAFT_516773, partial [Colletotrichum caudatum]
KTLEPCLVRNLEMDQHQSGTDQHSRVAEAKSQSRFDGVEEHEKEEMSRKVRARQVAPKGLACPLPAPPFLQFLNGFCSSLSAVVPSVHFFVTCVPETDLGPSHQRHPVNHQRSVKLPRQEPEGPTVPVCRRDLPRWPWAR